MNHKGDKGLWTDEDEDGEEKEEARRGGRGED